MKDMKDRDGISIPPLKKIHSGKVRDSFRLGNDESKRLIVVSDRISAFDHILDSKIPYKGSILNMLTNFWFNKTKHIIKNHLIEEISSNASIVQEAKPIKLEFIVRKYISGSLWRSYSKGQRKFSTYTLPEGLTQNAALSDIIITPTTKDVSDQEISYQQIIESKIITKELLDYIYDVSLSLFKFVSSYLEERNILLVDTKFEFATQINDDKLILIDEIFTPDSSRFWYKSQYEKNQIEVESPDKEFVRKYLMDAKESKASKEMPKVLPDDIVCDTTKRYIQLYQDITGMLANQIYSINSSKISSKNSSKNCNEELYKTLIDKNIIKDGLIVIVMGSKNDLEHALKIKKICNLYDVDVMMRVISAHKNGEEISNLGRELNNSINPTVVIAIAGRSNGLGGSLAYNLTVPVINIPPFKDNLDMFLNINSSLIMPQNASVATSVDVEGGTRLALKALQLERLKSRFASEIIDLKDKLKNDDQEVQAL
ncbi:MAG: AIR carboxylase family protein [Oligoflexia bacterium]|nr:AIR carboxylase family protein [Oligoflexia bacterium]